ncbi:cyclin pho85 family protein [Schizosaccharomyces japonicus yFS275]|uniref:Cyclin pho85 family protein n=1 Tax=Schizosaccharomyces japonicus (strain yFS275 / FY16936) TaxID=402676 RepID=T0TB47_SCHJY|nr:cyclin pho85 family protein [Schizosaccharomyces japonicus yFS275]EQC53053.1 cyclin pho85 family protein [Schizosaccharomyces japonicus yFS275]
MILLRTILQLEHDVPTRRMDIAHYKQEDLIEMMATLLLELSESNFSTNSLPIDALKDREYESCADSVSLFCAKKAPSITIHAYLTRIFKYCPATNDVFLSLLVYFDRLVVLSGGAVVIGNENIHRLLIAGFTCASKYWSDVYYTNSRSAKVGGIRLQELNTLELHYFSLLKFSLYIRLEELQQYADGLLHWYTKRQQLNGSNNSHEAKIPKTQDNDD